MLEPMTLLLLAAMGFLAGMINAAVGSGSLLTLPVLLAVGVPPGAAVRTNTIGMMFSTIGSALRYRREIAAEGREALPLCTVALLCAATGSILLLLSPGAVLQWVVPVLITLALVLVVSQPRITAVLRRRLREHPTEPSRSGGATHPGGLRSPGLLVSMGAASAYGGYFTAAQGILYLALLGVFTGREMRDVNAMKVALSLIVNVVAAAVYVVAWAWLGAEVLWWSSVVLAVSSFLGGFIGGGVAKRLPEPAMRGVIIAVALVALVRQVL